MFEKLEFYLNLKNDFALTFIQDKHRVYFFSKKKNPQNVNESVTRGKYLVAPDVTSLIERVKI